MPPEFFDSMLILFVLMNPFLLSIYLLDLIHELDGRTFRRVLLRGAAIATAVFVVFALAGDVIFTRLLHVRLSAFLIFGGIIFLIIGVRFVLTGSEALRSLRGDAEHVAGSIAMPFMVGPGTVSASVLAGSRLSPTYAVLSIVAAMVLAVVSVMLLKWLFDNVKTRNEKYVGRYVDIVGRISALVIGTIAVEMILQGIEMWGVLEGIAAPQRPGPG